MKSYVQDLKQSKPSLMRRVKLDTGVHVIAYKGGDGVTRFKALTQSQYNLHYKHNVWWTKFKEYLNSININTIK